MQKYTVKLLLKKNKPNAKGFLPIYIRITVDRRASFISTGHFIPSRFWDEKNEQIKPEYAYAEEFNIDILERKKEVLQNLVNSGIKKAKVTSSDIKTLSVLGDEKNNLFSFFDRFKNEMQNKREASTIENWRKHLLKLEKFHGSTMLDFEQITPEYLVRFENYLLGEGVNRRNDSSNYAHAVIKSVRKIFNAAIKKKVTSHYPFDNYEMPEVTAGDKDHLTLKELDTWTGFYKTCKDEFLREAALYFLFGCYSGLRISDWFLFDLKKRVHKDHIAVRAKKNGQWITIPFTKRLQFVISEIKNLPLVSPEPNLNKRFKDIARACKIDKHISSHCARKTFAVTLCLERGISSETASELMGITLNTFVKAYSKVTPAKIKAETSRGWKGL